MVNYPLNNDQDDEKRYKKHRHYLTLKVATLNLPELIKFFKNKIYIPFCSAVYKFTFQNYR